jgi:hypothetical protein
VGAWCPSRFYHSKGFLCNGDEFVGDWESTPAFVGGDRIGVRLDLTRSTLHFTCNGKPVPGELMGIGAKVVCCAWLPASALHAVITSVLTDGCNVSLNLDRD